MVDVLIAQAEDSGRMAGMSFRAVFAGWLVATGIAVLLVAGGLAMGFSAFDAWHAQASAKGIGIGTSIWMVLTWIVSLGLGGMFASWYAAHDDRTIGTLHGVTVWALAVTVVFFWIASGLGAMHRGNGPMHANRATPPAGMPAGPAPTAAALPGGPGDGSMAVLRADVQARLTSRDPQATDQIVAALLGGQDNVAASLFAAVNRTSTADGAGAVAAIAADTQAAQLDAKRRADRIAHDIATALWVGFASVLLGLIAATLGGWLGAHHIGRIYHLRSFQTSVGPSIRR